MNLIRLAEAGDTAGVLRELRALTLADRAGHAEALAARAEALAASPDGHPTAQRAAQRAAELGCQASPGAAAEWLVRNPPWRPARNAHPDNYQYLSYDQATEVLGLYPPAWRAELVARLAAVRVAQQDYYRWFPLAEWIIRDTGCPVPATDRFINAWLDNRSSWARADPAGGTLPERLRKDDLAPELLQLAVTRPGVWLAASAFGCFGENSQLGALISLSADGTVDRGALIRRLFTDVIGGPEREDLFFNHSPEVLAALALSPAEHASVTDDRVRIVGRLLEHACSNFLGRDTYRAMVLLRALAPTAAENARFTKEHLRMLASNSWSPSAAAVIDYAKDALLGADRAGLLTAEAFTEVIERALDNPGSYRPAAVVSRLSVGGGIDRGTLIQRIFASGDPYPGALTVTALALTADEHAGVSGERVRLVELLLANLLQEDRRQVNAHWLELLRALAPTAAENARFTREYLALLDRSSAVAEHAQRVLLGVDEAGLLETDALTEMCQRVLLRPEKKLVRVQLAGLDRAARRDPARAARLTVDAATAFQHQEPALQERALDVVARHLTAAGEAVQPELRAAADWLSPAFAARAAELFGPSHGASGPSSEVLPAVPLPRPVPGPVATAAEVAQEVAAIVAGNQDVAAFERALDELVRHARGDRAALAGALKPAMRRKPAPDCDCRPADLYDVAMAVRGEEPRESAFHAREPGDFSLAGAMLAARMSEAIDLITNGGQPFLLAVPTRATGALDAGILVERLRELEELGAEPAQADLAQALLRATPTDDPQTLDAAGRLRSEAGQRLAKWLHDGGLPHQDSEPEGWDQEDRGAPGDPALPGVALGSWFPPAAAALIGPHRNGRIIEPPAPFWVAQLPHHRDETTARDYCAHIAYGIRQRTRVLPFVAEADGPAGYAVHLALARGTAHSPHGDEPTVDALLVLAARGQLDAELLGRQLAALLRTRSIEANRVGESLRAAAETGAYGTVWAIIKAALPALLRGTPHKNAAAFLSLAAQCVSRCGAKGEIPEVTAAAERRGSSQTTGNARLLREALRSRADQHGPPRS